MTAPGYASIDEVARTAAGLTDDVRTLHGPSLLAQLAGIVEHCPTFAAQLLMTLALWVDPDEPADERTARLRAIARQKDSSA